MTSLTVSIAANADDGFWSPATEGNTFNASGTESEFGDSGDNDRHTFWRFQNVTIPGTATISAARVDFVANQTNSSATCNVTLRGEAADNPAAPTTVAQADARALTTASVAWNAVPSQTAGTTYSTPDISTVVQEIIDRAGWASGNALIVYVRNNASSKDARRYAATLEHTTRTEPKLIVTYTTAETLATSGTLTSAGALVRQPRPRYAGTLTSAGALRRALTLGAYLGTLTSAGALARGPRLAYSGTLTTSGTLARAAAPPLMSGTLTPSGTLVRRVGLALAGGLTPAGALLKRVALAFTGALTSAGGLGTTVVVPIPLAGSVDVAFALNADAASYTAAGAVDVSGSLAGAVNTTQSLAGSINTSITIGGN